MIVVALLGRSCTGKTTFTANISRFLTCDVIHVGEILRQKYPNQQNGDIAPECVVWDIIVSEITRAQTGVIILDGFPRTLGQLASFEQHYCLPIIALLFNATENNLRKRRLSRNRVDDGTVKKVSYDLQTVPVINYLTSKQIVKSIDANSTPDHVLQQCFTQIRKTFIEKKVNFSDGSCLRVERLSPYARPPIKGSPWSVGVDIFAAESKIIQPYETQKVSADIAIEIPSGAFGLITGRSSLSARGILVHMGVIDPAFSDSLVVCLTNLSQTAIRVDRNNAVAQFLLIKAFYPKIIEAPVLKSDRGSFGSSNAIN